MPTAPATPPPDAASLYQAAINHLARYSATELGLRRVLQRQIERWAQSQADQETAIPAIAAAKTSIDSVIGRLVQAGLVSDAAFAETRAKTLVRSGRSNRAVQARLIAKGVASDVARAASDTSAETELAAALVFVRKRRIGPYRTAGEADTAMRMKDMAILARAGFSREIASQALATTRDEAESRIHDLRQ